MFSRFLLPLTAALALLLAAACRDEKITTYRVPKETPAPAVPHDSMAVMTPDLTAPDAPADTGPLAWQAPASWTVKPLGAMRKGSFLVKGDDGAAADVSIISFPGAAGGLVENLNRWRGQLKLPALSSEQLSSMSTALISGDFRFTVVDFSGQGAAGPTRILGAVLPLGDETYFFKFIGPSALAEEARPDFFAFLKTVKTR